MPYDPNREMNGMPAGEPAPPVPPEASGEPLPTDNIAGQMAGGLQQASPEEQAQADQFVLRAWQVIYDDNVFPQIIEALRGGAGQDPETGETAEGDPAQGLAMAADMVVSRVGQAAEDEGALLHPDAVMHAFGDIVEELAEVSRRAQIKDYSQDHDALEKAYYLALDRYRERLDQAGVIDKEAHQEGLRQIMAADQDGSYEKILRTLADHDESGPAGGPEPPPQRERKPKGFNAAMGI